MKKFILILIISFVASIGYISAQRGYTSFNYTIGFGTGDLGEYISNTSFRGFLFEYKKVINDNIYVGFDAGINVFYERKDYDTYTIGTESISGVQYRYNHEVPLLIAADYYFRPGLSFNPYANLGLGVVYSNRKTDMGVFRLEEEAWQFVLKPEVGFLYEINSKGALKFSVKYYNGFESGDLQAQSYVAIGFGYVVLF